MRYLLILLIRIYQKTISPDHGWLANWRKKKGWYSPACRFSPTCSQYGLEAIAKYGSIKGTVLAAWHIVRCNPWSTPMGTYEPVPSSFSLEPLKYNKEKSNGIHHNNME